ncbi:MAG: pentapeptide repeat-containing protein [Bacteroidales bacterium]|nr:pentapeptide repeat-containing protein [Bacteroidales bacterium]
MKQFIENLMPSPLVEAFGHMIIQSLWQGAAVSLLMGLMLLFTRKFSAKSRYFIAVAFFISMPVISVFTFVKYYQAEKHISAVVPVMTEQAAPARGIIESAKKSQTVKAIEHKVNRDFSLKTFNTYFSQNIPLIVTCWLLGMLFFMLKFLGGLAYTQRLKHYRTQPVSQQWQDKFKKLCENLKVTTSVKILQSAMVKVPAAIGFFRPVILFPVSAFTGLPAKELEMIIMHELAHIIRRDYLVNIMQSLVEIIFFFHPAVWWMSKTIRAERENCCDDIAIEKSGDSIAFAKALANFQEQFLLNEKLAMAINGNNNNLFKRIKRLLNQPNMKTNFNGGFTASCVIFAGVLIMMFNTGMSEYISRAKDPENFNTRKNIPLWSVEDTSGVITPRHNEKASPEDMLMDLESNNNKTAGPNAGAGENDIKEDSAYIRSGEEEQMLEEEIIRGVKTGLDEIDVDIIVDEAAKGAEAGINQVDLNLIVNEALQGVDAGLEAVDALAISAEILDGIRAALVETDLNLIASEILSGVRFALEEINFNTIVENQVVNQVNDEINRGNDEHIILLKQGPGVWNKWRSEHPDEVPDLRSVVLPEANLTSADLRFALLDNANLSEATLDWANLESASMRYTILKEASLNGAKLAGADLTGADLKEVNLSRQNLRGVFFNYANLKEADLSLSDLRDCDFSNANLREADLTKADLRGANLKFADLSEAKLAGVKFEGAVADRYTLFPQGFDPIKEKVILQN